MRSSTYSIPDNKMVQSRPYYIDIYISEKIIKPKGIISCDFFILIELMELVVNKTLLQRCKIYVLRSGYN